jgi:hypothetical protein
MYYMNRKTTPKVVGGKTQRKNRWAQTPNCYNTRQDRPVIDRRRPGAGYRHVLKKRDVKRFIGLLPDWDELSIGLNVIQLAPGHPTCDGWHRPGVVAVCAWPIDQAVEASDWYYREHRKIFKRLGVPCFELSDAKIRCEFNDSMIRAYQLLHILLHELGHHHDRMTTKSKRQSSRGERFAERYALNYADRIWERYLEEFGLP